MNKRGKIENKFGWIDYYYEISDNYPVGVLVDLGGYVHKEFRGQGKLKYMLNELISMFPEGTIVQMAVKNKKLIPMFKRWGFKYVKKIAYWGEISHAMECVITPKLLEDIKY